jgi:spore coat protein U-like protein
MNLSKSFKCAAVFGVVALGFATAADAVTTVTNTFTVTANVTATCSITAGPLAFGTYTGAVVNATSNINVTCTNSTPYNVGLSAGAASGATVTTRQMLNGTSPLNYALYSDTGRTKNWGVTIGTDTVTGTGSGASQTIPVYGTVPAGQYAPSGSYADTVTASITY